MCQSFGVGVGVGVGCQSQGWGWMSVSGVGLEFPATGLWHAIPGLVRTSGLGVGKGTGVRGRVRLATHFTRLHRHGLGLETGQCQG